MDTIRICPFTLVASSVFLVLTVFLASPASLTFPRSVSISSSSSLYLSVSLLLLFPGTRFCDKLAVEEAAVEAQKRTSAREDFDMETVPWVRFSVDRKHGLIGFIQILGRVCAYLGSAPLPPKTLPL